MTREQLNVKYNAAIRNIAEKNNVDLGVGLDMFIANAKKIAEAKAKAKANWYPGMGIVNLDQLIADIEAYNAEVASRKKK